MLDIFYWDGELQRCKTEHLPIIKHKKLWIDATNITKEEADKYVQDVEIAIFHLRTLLFPNDSNIKKLYKQVLRVNEN